MDTDGKKAMSQGETQSHGARIASALSSPQCAFPRFALPSVRICGNLWTQSPLPVSACSSPGLRLVAKLLLRDALLQAPACSSPRPGIPTAGRRAKHATPLPAQCLCWGGEADSAGSLPRVSHPREGIAFSPVPYPPAGLKPAGRRATPFLAENPLDFALRKGYPTHHRVPTFAHRLGGLSRCDYPPGSPSAESLLLPTLPRPSPLRWEKSLASGTAAATAS